MNSDLRVWAGVAMAPLGLALAGCPVRLTDDEARAAYVVLDRGVWGAAEAFELHRMGIDTSYADVTYSSDDCYQAVCDVSGTANGSAELDWEGWLEMSGQMAGIDETSYWEGPSVSLDMTYQGVRVTGSGPSFWLYAQVENRDAGIDLTARYAGLRLCGATVAGREGIDVVYASQYVPERLELNSRVEFLWQGSSVFEDETVGFSFEGLEGAAEVEAAPCP